MAIADIVTFFAENKNNSEMVKPILEACRELGYANPKEITDAEHAKIILAMTVK